MWPSNPTAGHTHRRKGKGKESRSVVSDSATPGNVACQTLLSIGFSRQEHWSVLPFPSPGDLPDPGTEPGSPALQADALLSKPPGKQYTPKKPELKETCVPQCSSQHCSQ